MADSELPDSPSAGWRSPNTSAPKVFKVAGRRSYDHNSRERDEVENVRKSFLCSFLRPEHHDNHHIPTFYHAVPERYEDIISLSHRHHQRKSENSAAKASIPEEEQTPMLTAHSLSETPLVAFRDHRDTEKYRASRPLQFEDRIHEAEFLTGQKRLILHSKCSQ